MHISNTQSLIVKYGANLKLNNNQMEALGTRTERTNWIDFFFKRLVYEFFLDKTNISVSCMYIEEVPEKEEMMREIIETF